MLLSKWPLIAPCSESKKQPVTIGAFVQGVTMPGLKNTGLSTNAGLVDSHKDRYLPLPEFHHLTVERHQLTVQNRHLQSITQEK